MNLKRTSKFNTVKLSLNTYVHTNVFFLHMVNFDNVCAVKLEVQNKILLVTNVVSG